MTRGVQTPRYIISRLSGIDSDRIHEIRNQTRIPVRDHEKMTETENPLRLPFKLTERYHFQLVSVYIYEIAFCNILLS
jgi:hypothetical protein